MTVDPLHLIQIMLAQGSGYRRIFFRPLMRWMRVVPTFSCRRGWAFPFDKERKQHDRLFTCWRRHHRTQSRL